MKKRNSLKYTNSRGLESVLAKQVAEQLMAHDALGAHARDEIGISESVSAQPVQAALSSAVTFTVGASTSIDGGVDCTRQPTYSFCRSVLSCFSRPSWRYCCACRRRVNYCRCHQSYFLGCACNGTNGRCRVECLV